MNIAGRRGLEVATLLAASFIAGDLLVNVNLKAAAGFVIVVVVLGVLAVAQATPAARMLVFGVLGLSATVDLIGHVRFGKTTAYAWVTGVVVATAVGVALAAPAGFSSPASRRTTLYMTILPAWAILSFLWAPPSLEGAQNALIYVALPALAAVSTHASASGVITYSRLRRSMFVMLIAGSLLYCASLLLGGLGGNAVVSARVFGLFAVVGVAWSVALARTGHRTELRMALLLSTLAFLSLSRTAFITCLVLLVVGLVGVRTIREVRRSVAVVAVVAAVAFVISSFSNPFSARFSNGDVSAVAGGFAINVTGRKALWQAAWDDALRHPAFGGGVGRADEVVRLAAPGQDNPHNDYLRAFDDLGIVGFIALVLALVVPATANAAAYRAAARQDTQQRSVHLAAVLMLVGLALGMGTDNPLVYLFVLAPVAVVVGSSLGLRDRTYRFAGQVHAP